MLNVSEFCDGVLAALFGTAGAAQTDVTEGSRKRPLDQAAVRSRQHAGTSVGTGGADAMGPSTPQARPRPTQNTPAAMLGMIDSRYRTGDRVECADVRGHAISRLSGVHGSVPEAQRTIGNVSEIRYGIGGEFARRPSTAMWSPHDAQRGMLAVCPQSSPHAAETLLSRKP